MEKNYRSGNRIMMKSFIIQKQSINRYLPKKKQFVRDIIIYYSPNDLIFHCNQCGRCCGLLDDGNDAFTTILCDIDIKQLKRVPLNIKENFPELTSLMGAVQFTYLKSIEGRLLAIKKNYVNGCAFYNPEKHKCEIYTVRPLTCNVFPYILREVE